jgi:hypothetical protein
VVLAGYARDEAAAREALAARAPAVRAAAWGALARMGAVGPDELAGGLADPAPAVRRRACELLSRQWGSPLAGRVRSALLSALSDGSPIVVEAACSALGEALELSADGGAGELACGATNEGGGAVSGAAGLAAGGAGAIAQALAGTARSHPDARCREAAVAALGALAASAGRCTALAALTDALGDKATVRRRAVVALGRFGGDARRALEQALRDRDWQVRELAEQLLRAEAGPSVHEQVTD